jgi:hypothetical protein
MNASSASSSLLIDMADIIRRHSYTWGNVTSSLAYGIFANQGIGTDLVRDEMSIGPRLNVA